MKAWYAFYDHEAANSYRFQLEQGHVDLKLDSVPAMRWTNPLEEGNIHGVLYIWRLSGRPIVIGQLFSYLNGKGGRVYCHAMHSLANKGETVTGWREGKVFWTPKPPGLELRDVPDAATPADSRTKRLSQMRAISRRFSAYTEEMSRGKRNLRLLPTPLDRFPENDSSHEDGALFSLVVGNDPEVILVLAEGSSGGEPTWQYGMVRSTRSTSVALLDEKEVWRFDAADANPSDIRNGYLSVHGIATLPLEPPLKIKSPD